MHFNIYNLNNLPLFNEPIYIIGSFESFHLGHNLLLKKAKEIKNDSSRDIVLVFFKDVENLRKNIYSTIFTNFMNRIQSFANLGFQNGIYLEFDKVKNLSRDEFLNLLFAKQINFDIVTGVDFKFGSKASGDVNFLVKKFGFQKIHSVETLKIGNNIKISTSLIKESIELGDIELVNSLNLFKYSFNVDIVKKDDEINVLFDKNIVLPPSGLYLTFIEINNYNYYAILKIDFKMQLKIEFIDFVLTKKNIENAKIIFIKTLRFFKDFNNNDISLKDINKAKEEFQNI